MSLEHYRRRRDFGRTPEPAGEAAPDVAASDRPGGLFVVQRHRARRLHYDLRLEIDDVLASWAVPRGPTLDPSVRRMAVHVEDHPLGYADFEGRIPDGEYGAGDVIVWDRGTWEPELPGDPAGQVRGGELKFSLSGAKLQGRFTLVRTTRNPADERGGAAWLLIKKRDAWAVPGWDPEAHPRSALSGRTNDEVASGVAAGAISPTDVRGARAAPIPEFVEPMAATLAVGPFSDPDWRFEVKWDGYRVEAVVRGGAVRLWTRNRQDASRYFPALAGPPDWLAAREAIVDGEVVALRPDGTADFGLLQAMAGGGMPAPGSGQDIGASGASPAAAPETPAASPGGTLAYEVFDLLHLDGYSMLDVPFDERTRVLRAVLRPHPLVRYAGRVEADGEAFFAAVAARGVEGMVAKRRDSRYEPGRRSRDWLKVKVRPEQELVIAGYTTGAGSAADLAALLAAVTVDGRLRHAGRVGTGFDEPTRRALLARLEPLQRPTPAVDDAPRLPGARWIEPRLVMRVAFAGWTAAGLVRQASFRGLDLERDPSTVVRERPEVGGRRAGTARPRRNASAAQVTRREGIDRAEPAPGGGIVGATPDELEALDRLPAHGGRWQVGGHVLALTNLDRVLFPVVGLTKRDLIRYYVTVGPVLLPYLAGRAVNLTRWPDGIEGPHFWQQAAPARAPSWVVGPPPDRTPATGPGSAGRHVRIVVGSVAALAWLANLAAIEIHPSTAPLASPDHPSFALVDIDPGERTTWDETVLLARLVGDALRHLRVTGHPKLTGRRGIQVWIPVRPQYSFDQTRGWVEALSRAIGAAVPELVSWAWEKHRRDGRARLDYTQNAPNRTLVAPYAVRAMPVASVSAPITWDELDDPDLRPDRWTIATIGERLRARGDLFRGVLDEPQDLPPL